MNSIADKLRANQQTFHNREFVVQYGKQKLESVYGSHSDAINSYSNALSRAGLQNARIMEQLDLSEKAHKFLTLIKEKTESSVNLKAYIDQLIVVDQDIVDSDLSNKEKAILRVQIVALQTSLVFVAKNFDLFRPKANSNGRISNCGDNECEKIEDSNWWDDWGKCAAGSLGTAGTEALAGCGIGAAAGLGVASIPGCGVGAIVGGVSGALIGAAIFC